MSCIFAAPARAKVDVYGSTLQCLYLPTVLFSLLLFRGGSACAALVNDGPAMVEGTEVKTVLFAGVDVVPIHLFGVFLRI